jgi:hypothetical protein
MFFILAVDVKSQLHFYWTLYGMSSSLAQLSLYGARGAEATSGKWESQYTAS